MRLPILLIALTISQASQAKTELNISGNIAEKFKSNQESSLFLRRSINASVQPVTLDVVLHKTDKDTLEHDLQPINAKLLAFNPKAQRASIQVNNLEQAKSIAKLPQVKYVYPEYGYKLSAGVVNSRAPKALKLDSLKNAPLSLSGKQQTIGILSDSFARTNNIRSLSTTPNACISGSLMNAKNQSSGELPDTIDIRADNNDVTTCPNQGSNVDEGAAMAELVHDIAPDAKIAFHTAAPGIAGFANGIDDLCTSKNNGGAGATIVVDDIIYLSQLMYQPDAVSLAASNCVQNNIPFFSAAGNNADLSFHENYKDSSVSDNDAANWDSNTTFVGSDLHQWGNGRNYLSIRLEAGEGFSAVLQWNQPALSVPNSTQGPQIDLDMYLFNSGSLIQGNVLAKSINNQVHNSSTTGADPVEIIDYVNTLSTSRTVKLVIDHAGGSQTFIPQSSSTPLEFRLVFFEQDTTTLSNTDFSPNAGAATMYGHTISPDVISVAAVPWWEAPAFNPNLEGTANTDPESFTSQGGLLQYHFAADGSFLIHNLPQKPDIAAVDGNNTSFFGEQLNLGGYEGESDGHPNFFGSSAAAPNAAASTALLLEQQPLSPAVIKTLLQQNTIPAGPADLVGAGLIQLNSVDLGGLPIAEAGHDKTIKVGETITLTGSVSNLASATGPFSFEWKQTNGSLGSLAISETESNVATFSANKAGVANLSFSVSNNAGQKTTDSVTITITDVSKKSKIRGGGFWPLQYTIALMLMLFYKTRRKTLK